MAVTLHFIDNTSVSISAGQDTVPIDANYVEVTGGGGVHVALVPTAQLKYAENA